LNRFTITRSLDTPPDRVWEIIGNPGKSPGRGVGVRVERPGSADGTGLIRVVKVGPARVREEITGVGPGHVIRYRMLKGAPVRDYTSGVGLVESTGGGTLISWDAQFRPVVPGTGWVFALVSKYTLNHVLDAVAESARSPDQVTAQVLLR
jgi:Polyketide cyclase / dehydrase and lipid transport